MSWDYQRSRDRIQKHLDGMGEITVEEVVREAHMHELLSETCRGETYGAHVYSTVTNFARLASDGLYAQDDYKRLIRAVHIRLSMLELLRDLVWVGRCRLLAALTKGGRQLAS